MRVLTSEPWADIKWLSFSPDGTAVGLSATESGYNVRDGSVTGTEVWDVVAGERRPTENTGLACPARFCFHPSGRWLLGSSEKSGLVVYDLATQEPRIEKVESAHVTNVLATPDGKKIVYYHYEYDRSNRGYACREWNPDGEFRPLWSAPTLLAPKGDSCTYGFALLADGDRILTCEREGGFSASTYLALRSLETGEVLASAPVGGYDHPTLALAPDDSGFVMLSKNLLLVFPQMNPKAVPRVIRNDGKKHFTAAAFHPSGKFLAVTSNDETVRLFDTVTWRVARTFTWDIGKMRSIAFSPDGTLAAAGSDQGKVVVWDVDL